MPTKSFLTTCIRYPFGSAESLDRCVLLYLFVVDWSCVWSPWLFSIAVLLGAGRFREHSIHGWACFSSTQCTYVRLLGAQMKNTEVDNSGGDR